MAPPVLETGVQKSFLDNLAGFSWGNLSVYIMFFLFKL